MPRILGEGIRNTFNVRDKISGDVLTVYYRIPTPAERQAYEAEKFQREGKTVKIRITEARQKWGLEILEGLKEGCFEVRGKDGKLKPVASDPGSENYDPNWKEMIFKQASDVIEALAGHVFDGVEFWSSQEVPEEEYDEKN